MLTKSTENQLSSVCEEGKRYNQYRRKRKTRRKKEEEMEKTGREAGSRSWMTEIREGCHSNERGEKVPTTLHPSQGSRCVWTTGVEPRSRTSQPAASRASGRRRFPRRGSRRGAVTSEGQRLPDPLTLWQGGHGRVRCLLDKQASFCLPLSG